MKSKQECIDILRAHASELNNQFGITYMRLFGSVAKGTFKEDSDVDLFVEMPPSFVAICEATDYLEHLLGCNVDLIRNHSNIRPFFLNQIEKYGIDIFRTTRNCS